MPSPTDVLDYVARHEGAIGYISYVWVTERVSVIRVNDIQPSFPTIGQKKYPLTRPVYVLFPASPTPAIALWRQTVTNERVRERIRDIYPAETPNK